MDGMVQLQKGGTHLEPGSWIDGRYKIIRLLGKGREGSVYLAFQEKLFRFYAIKEVNKEGICFSRESMEVWKTLQCVGLPEITDVLESEEWIWIVMEYVEGNNLQDYLEKGNAVSVKQAADWCLQVTDVLEYLQKQNPPIIYGDLKPENLIIRKNRIVMVDMGSLIRQGSTGKRTGTMEYAPGSAQTEKQAETGDGYSLGKLMELLAFASHSPQMRRISRSLMRTGSGKSSEELKNIRRKLKKLKSLRRMEQWMLFLTAVLLIFTGQTAVCQMHQESTERSYDNDLAEVQMLNEGARREKLVSLIKENPQRKEAYLKLLDLFQEDLKLDEEEEHLYRKLWKERLPGKKETCEVSLKKNPEGYQEVAYESGLTYWYFFEGIQGWQYAGTWFRKVTEIPEKLGGNQEIRRKSILYGKMGEYREKWKRYDETGENDGIFEKYWMDISQLLGENRGEISMVRMLLWKESLAAWKHYMVELREAGVTRIQIEELLGCMESEIRQVPEGHERMQELKNQMNEDGKQIREMLQRIYQ